MIKDMQIPTFRLCPKMADGQQNMDGAVAEEKMEECSTDNQPAQVKSEQKIKMLMYISGARLSY